MFQKETAVEIANLSQHGVGLRGAFVFRLGKSLEEERSQKLAVVEIRPVFSALGKFVLEVVLVTVIEKELLLKEVDEHQAIEHD